MRRAARVDGNHQDVVTAFRRMGVAVQSLHTLGGGVPDLLCSARGRTWLVEIKDGDSGKPPSALQLNPDQEEWHRAWKGAVYVVQKVADVPDVVLSALRGEEVEA